MRFKAIPAVFLVLQKENKLLLQRRLHSGWEDGKYTFVSGHVEENETPIQAIIRETKEEIGITVREKDLKAVHFMYRKGTDTARMDIYFTCSTWQGEIQNMEPDKHDDIAWFEIDTLPQNTTQIVKFFLEKLKKKEIYSEFGW